jgi:hypothetical protein
VWRTRLPEPAVLGLRWTAAGLLYGVAAARLVADAGNVLVLVAVGLVGLGAGAALRVRPWIWSATAFLVAVVVLQAARFGIAHQLGLGVLLSVAGIAVLGGMVAFTVYRGRTAPPPDPPTPSDGA